MLESSNALTLTPRYGGVSTTPVHITVLPAAVAPEFTTFRCDVLTVSVGGGLSAGQLYAIPGLTTGGVTTWGGRQNLAAKLRIIS